MNPHAALQSLMTFMVRHKTLFVFCVSRAGAEYCCYSLLGKFLREEAIRTQLPTGTALNARFLPHSKAFSSEAAL